MRIGNSQLRNHMHRRELRLCQECDMKVPETNEHYFEVCKTFNIQRNKLKYNGRLIFQKLNMKFNTANLLGMNQKIMKSKKLQKKV